MSDGREDTPTERLEGALIRGLRAGSRLPMLHVDAFGIVRIATQAAADLLGRTRDDLVGRTLGDLAHEDDAARAQTLVAAVAAGVTAPRNVEFGVELPGGGVLQLDVSMVRSDDEQGHPLVLTLEDVTDQREKRSRERRQLGWFRALTEHSGDVIIVTDVDGSHRFVSGAAPSVLGRPGEDWTRQLWLDSVHPQDRPRVEKAMREVLEHEGEQRRFAYRLRHADDRWLHVETKGINQLSHPDVEGVIFYLRDVGERMLRDPLTGLPNRVLFVDRLDEIITEREHRPPFAVALLSLERFKKVKRGLGPRFADEMLAELVDRAREYLPDDAMLARLNDAELVLLLEGMDEPQVQTLADALRGCASLPFQLAGQAVHSELHVGIALSRRGYTRSDAMLRDADTALARAATDGGQTVANTHLIRKVSGRLLLEGDLRRAIAEDRLRLHYQPIVQLATGRIEGFEALVRWNHSRRGLISPGLFVPLAEETGLITELDGWVMRAAAAQLRRWNQRIAKCPDLYLHINLSARQFRGEGPLDALMAAVLGNDLEPAQLRVELTETALADRPEDAARILAGLREAGFQVALDDFGTGYSSLGYLSRFEFDSLKIDRSFVSGPTGLETSNRTLKLVRAILELGRSLDLEVVAEGIETEAQRTLLQGMGCPLAQGYHLGRPVPAKEARALLDPTSRIAKPA